jgi:RNA polymerase sigma-70 factor (ECF subfamily)
MVKHAPTAQELLQDVFVKLWEKRETINITISRAAYLYRMSANRVADYFAANANNKIILTEIITIAGTNYNPVEDAISFKETSQLLFEAVAALPLKRREVFELCKMEGKTYTEAGQILGISANTVHSQIGKAMKTIEDQLSRDESEQAGYKLKNSS